MAAIESTKHRALCEGRVLLQRFGFEAFSFQDIAEKLGLRKQSLYVHFKSKEALANELIEDYRKNLKTWTETVSYFKPEDQIGAWFEFIYKFSSEDLKYCSIAALASDYNSLPKSARKNLHHAFDELKSWFIDVIRQGQKDQAFRHDIKSEDLAEMVLALAFGGQQLARLTNSCEQIKKRQQNALKLLKG